MKRKRSIQYQMSALKIIFIGQILAWAFLSQSAIAEIQKNKAESQFSSVAGSGNYQKDLATRKKAARQQRRIIQNNDGDDIFGLTFGLQNTPCTRENFLKLRCFGLEETQVDSIFYCWRPAGGKLLDYGNFTEAELRTESPLWNKGKTQIDSKASYALLSQSMDIMIDFAHRNGKELFWSVRMNDVHDSTDPRLFSKWKTNHPQCLMGQKKDKFPFGAEAWSALDYTQSEVRDRMFSIAQKICSNYDIDGIELDFFRHPLLFKPQMFGQPITQEHCDMMTDLLRRIRRMTETVSANRNRPILIAIHIPDSIGYNKAIGLDLRQLLKEDLVDMVIGGGGYFRLEPWENLVSLGKEYDIPVYAGFDALNLQIAPNKGSLGEKLYNEAVQAWNAGVDGIYLFNCFSPRMDIWKKLGSLSILKKQGYDPGYQPYAIPDAGFEYFLKGGNKYFYAVRINAKRNIFIGSAIIEMQFPDSQYEIFYSLDGTEPNIASCRYQGPFAIDKTTTVTAQAFNKHGIKSWPSQQKFIKAQKILRPYDNELPAKMQRQPIGSEIKLNYDVPFFPKETQAALYLTMGDVDEQKEVQIFINNQGPLSPPKEIESPLRPLSAILSLPVGFIKPGKNQIRLVFANNLNGKTVGFYVDDAQVLLFF
ncbi:MAG: hypothetical protein A2Y12_11830 [Planctomycetes bacterium GWF2_42_9]|nr:MAG: hypothetical protein A2Y12_11830 [Planctomycetes bacterium GWF2_42_9]